MSFFLGKRWSIILTRIRKISPRYSTFIELEPVDNMYSLDIHIISDMVYAGLHVTGSGCALVFERDLEYWNIDPYSLGRKLN